MSNGLFREKSLEKISSPEQINEYIKTSSPSTWVIFFAVVVLLLGALVWGIWGNVELTISAVTVCQSGQAVCYVSENDIGRLSEQTVVRIEDTDYTLHKVSDLPVLASEPLSPYGLHLAGFAQSEWVYPVELNADLSDGIYKTEVVLERISPISLLIN